jgi:hypothetical protein
MSRLRDMGRRVQAVQTGMDSGQFTLALNLTDQMNCKGHESFFYLKANIFKLKRVGILNNHDLIFITQKTHKTGPNSVQIGKQVCGQVYDFLNQHVNFFDLLGVGFLLNTLIYLFKNGILKFK